MEEDYEKKQRQSKITYGNQEYSIKSSGLKSHYYKKIARLHKNLISRLEIFSLKVITPARVQCR
ncbi:hypothetical protein HZS_6720 [Henneguya salminicola]|nr:hypothetical protein HZS_6720 [Henneguya salminicola]